MIISITTAIAHILVLSFIVFSLLHNSGRRRHTSLCWKEHSGTPYSRVSSLMRKLVGWRIRRQVWREEQERLGIEIPLSILSNCSTSWMIGLLRTERGFGGRVSSQKSTGIHALCKLDMLCGALWSDHLILC
jgi:hypothetical protein